MGIVQFTWELFVALHSPFVFVIKRIKAFVKENLILRDVFLFWYWVLGATLTNGTPHELELAWLLVPKVPGYHAEHAWEELSDEVVVGSLFWLFDILGFHAHGHEGFELCILLYRA